MAQTNEIRTPATDEDIVRILSRSPGAVLNLRNPASNKYWRGVAFVDGGKAYTRRYGAYAGTIDG